MSTTISTPSVPTCGAVGALIWDTPVQDPNCAIFYSKGNLDIMKKCCGDASIVSYYDDCGLYCVALEQTTEDLRKCFSKEGAVDGNFFCRDGSPSGGTATASADPKVPATAQASVVANGDDDDDKDDKDSDSKDDKDSDDDDSKDSDDKDSSSSSKKDDDDNAAPSVKPHSGITTLGVVISALLVSATAFGASL